MFAQENYLGQKTLQTIGSLKHQFAELLSSIGFIPGIVSIIVTLRQNGPFLIKSKFSHGLKGLFVPFIFIRKNFNNYMKEGAHVVLIFFYS